MNRDIYMKIYHYEYSYSNELLYKCSYKVHLNWNLTIIGKKVLMNLYICMNIHNKVLFGHRHFNFHINIYKNVHLGHYYEQDYEYLYEYLFKDSYEYSYKC